MSAKTLVTITTRLKPVPYDPFKISNKIVFSIDLRRAVEYHREQSLCLSVRKSKVLQMQLSNEAFNIIWLSHHVCEVW